MNVCKVMEGAKSEYVGYWCCLPGVWALSPCCDYSPATLGLLASCLCSCLSLPDGPLATFYLSYVTSTGWV